MDFSYNSNSTGFFNQAPPVNNYSNINNSMQFAPSPFNQAPNQPLMQQNFAPPIAPVQPPPQIEQPQIGNLFGIMIPGQLPLTQFEFFNGMFFVDLLEPQNISSISFFLFEALPDGFGAALYFSPPPYEDLQFIGAIGNARPSDIFHTGFSVKPGVNEAQSIKLVVKIQELMGLKSLVELTSQNDVQKNYAQLVAYNLYNFMNSYHKSGLVDGDYLVIPSNFLDKWIEKFQFKYQMDPNFIYKTTMDQ